MVTHFIWRSRRGKVPDAVVNVPQTTCCSHNNPQVATVSTLIHGCMQGPVTREQQSVVYIFPFLFPEIGYRYVTEHLYVAFRLLDSPSF